MIYCIFSNNITALLQWYVPVLNILTDQKCSHTSQINQTWSSRTNVLELPERWLAQTQKWKNHQPNQKSDEIRRDAARLSSTMRHCTAGVLHTLLRIVSDKKNMKTRQWKKWRQEQKTVNEYWYVQYGYLFEPFADIFASAHLVHLKGKSAQTTSQWSEWGGTSWSPEIVTHNWNCLFLGSPIWNYLCKVEWSGKGTTVAKVWAVLQYKITKQFQRRSNNQISG